MPTGDVAGRRGAASEVARAGLSLARCGTPPCGRRPASEDRRRAHLGVGANADTGQTSTRGSACFKSQDGTAALLGLEGLWILGCGGRICRLCTGPHSTAHAKNHYRSIPPERPARFYFRWSQWILRVKLTLEKMHPDLCDLVIRLSTPATQLDSQVWGRLLRPVHVALEASSPSARCQTLGGFN